MNHSDIPTGPQRRAQVGAPIVYFDATIRRKEKMRLASHRASLHQPEARDADAFPVTADGPLKIRTCDEPEIVTTVESPLETVLAEGTPAPPASVRNQSRLETKSLAAFAVNFIVEHTGYPPDIVDLNADLEADLGIDSITLAQLLGEIRDYCGVTPGGDLTLGSFKTISDILRIFQQSAIEQDAMGTETVA